MQMNIALNIVDDIHTPEALSELLKIKKRFYREFANGQIDTFVATTASGMQAEHLTVTKYHKEFSGPWASFFTRFYGHWVNSYHLNTRILTGKPYSAVITGLLSEFKFLDFVDMQMNSFIDENNVILFKQIEDYPESFLPANELVVTNPSTDAVINCVWQVNEIWDIPVQVLPLFDHRLPNIDLESKAKYIWYVWCIKNNIKIRDFDGTFSCKNIQEYLVFNS